MAENLAQQVCANQAITETMSHIFTTNNQGIIWKIDSSSRLPHHDHLEMSGRALSAVIEWEVTSKRVLKLNRRVFWPTLRGASDDLRGYLCRTFGDAIEPAVLINGVETDGSQGPAICLRRRLARCSRCPPGHRLGTCHLPAPGPSCAVRMLDLDQLLRCDHQTDGV